MDTVTLHGYRKNEDLTLQSHFESITLEELRKGGFELNKKDSILNDHFLFSLSTKSESGNMRNIRIYITGGEYEKFRDFLHTNK